MGEFWQPLYEEANHSADPPRDIYKRLEEVFERGFDLDRVLNKGDEVGISTLKEVMQLDSQAILPACELIISESKGRFF